MQLYLATDNISTVPDFVLENKNIYGITIRLPVSNFLFGDKYNEAFFNQFVKDVNHITHAGKKVAVGIIFGKYFPVFSNCRYAIIHDSHHNIPGHAIPTRQPVFWDNNYQIRVQDFFYWFSEKLKESGIYDSIEQIKITGVNERSEELRCSDMDFRTPEDTSEDAFRQSAEVWYSVGYNVSKVKMTIAGFIDIFANLFPDKIIALPVIGGLAGFPCININGICKPKEREDISKELIEYGVGSYPENFAPELTALAVDTGAPDTVCNSGAKEIIMQVRRQFYGTPPQPYPAPELEQQMFQKVIENGRNHNATVIEVFIRTVQAFPNMHG